MPFIKITPDNLPSRLVLSVCGGPKVGKTHFALTATPPIRYLNLDFGILELLPKFPDLDIEVAHHNMTDDTNPITFGKLLRAFHADYLWALANTPGGTVVVDTATQLWQIIQKINLDDKMDARAKAFRAKNKREPDEGEVRLYQYDYAQANTLMAGMLRRAMQQFTTNVVFIHRTKPVYDARGQATGAIEFQGFGETPAIVQMSVMLRSAKLATPDDNGQGFQVTAKIESCRFDKELEGFDIVNPTFDILASAVR